MAGGVFRLPQFSEETAWLPPWLQPDQFPAAGDEVAIDQTPFDLRCTSNSESPYGTRDVHFVKKRDETCGDGMLGSFHLYLSGEGNSSIGSILPSSYQASPLDLHLSSEGISQFSFEQCCNELQHDWDANETKKPLHEISAAANGISDVMPDNTARGVSSPRYSLNRNNPDKPHSRSQEAGTPNFQDDSRGITPPRESLNRNDPGKLHSSIQEEGMSDFPNGIGGILAPRDSLNRDDPNKQHSKNHEAGGSNLHNGTELEDKMQESICVGKALPGRGTSEASSDNPTKAKQKNRNKIKRKRKSLRDLEEPVELCIAASEAVIISDMATEDMDQNHFPVSSLLEVTLRVKQARMECHADHAEDCSNNVAEQIDETHLLYDLDDVAMEDAFDDAGIHCTQVVSTPDGCCVGEVIENHVNINRLGVQRQVSEININGSNLFCSRDKQKIDAAISMNAMDYQVQNLSPRTCSPHQREPPDNHSNYSTSNMNNSSADQIRSDQSCIKDSALNQVLLKEAVGTKVRKGRANLFLRESSFISESLDDFRDSRYIQGREPDIDIIASSNSVFNKENRTLSVEHENPRNNEILSSPGPVFASDFASIDPLCSMVPCSISSDDINLGDICGQKIFADKNETGQDKTADILFQNSSQDTIRPGGDEMRSTFAQSRDSRTVIKTNENSQVHRKMLNSLKSYSMITPSSLSDASLLERTTMLHPPVDIVTISKSNKQAVGPHKLVEFPKTTVQTSLLSHQSSFSRKFSAHVSSFLELKKSNNESCTPHTMFHPYRRRIQACPNEVNNKVEVAAVTFSPASKTEGLRTVISSGSIIPKDKDDVPPHVVYSNFHASAMKTCNNMNKRVRFSEAEIVNVQRKHVTGISCSSKYKNGLPFKTYKGQAYQQRGMSKKKRNIFPRNCIKQGNELALHGLEFLLTGFSRKKETEVENLIRIHGGLVLQNIPSPPKTYQRSIKPGRSRAERQIVLAFKKVGTTKFLYGCAINALILNVDWLHDSLATGRMLSPEKYLILPNRSYEENQLKNGQAQLLKGNAIFTGLGVMFYGKTSFCSKYESIIKHGGGQVFKTLHWLVQSLKNGKNSIGVILAEDENCVSRHLKHCALEQHVNTVTASWIDDSLFSSELLPLKEDLCAPPQRTKKLKTQSLVTLQEMSEEI